MSQEKTARLEPHKHIGAQDIANIGGGCTRNGFLRKQGKLERIFKFLTWRQRYVVIAQGCLYVYKNEFSRSFQMAVSLKNYTKTIRDSNVPRMPFVFRVMPHDPTVAKVIVFSSLDETTQKRWMAAIKKDLLKANDVQLENGTEFLDDYVYLEKDVRAHQEEAAASKEIDPEIDYSEIKEMEIGKGGPKHLPNTSSLPTPTRKPPQFHVEPPKSATIAVAKTASDTKATHVKKKPLPAPKSKPLQGVDDVEKPKVDRKSYLFNGSDRSQVENLLLSKTEGTFLVRESRSDGREVLSVNIGDSLKEYKIYTKNKQCTIDNTSYFSTTDELLLHYHYNCLPNKTVKLTKAYLLQSAGYVNERFAVT